LLGEGDELFTAGEGQANGP